MTRRTVWIDGKDVPLRPWEVDLAQASDAALVRLMRGLLAVHGHFTDAFTMHPGDRKATVQFMVWLPDGHLERFRGIARPWQVRHPARATPVGIPWRCIDGACAERCPAGHHGGREWQAVGRG